MALVSILVPVYFNAPSLPALWERLAALARAQAQHEFEFVFIDDGSEDDSWKTLCGLAVQDERIVLVRLTRNFGSTAALLAGIAQARGACIGFVAADLQDPPETLAEMLACWEKGARVVFAVRRDRRGDPLTTRALAGAFNWLYGKLVFRGFSPQGVGFWLIDREVAEVVKRCDEKNSHLTGLIQWTGYPHVEVAYDRCERPYGQSRWTLPKKIKYFIDAFIAFSYLPLRLASTLGFLLSLAGGIYAIFVIAAAYRNHVAAPGWSALMVVILLLGGIQLIILGVIGEYLWRNLDATRRRPAFVVDEVVRGSGL